MATIAPMHQPSMLNSSTPEIAFIADLVDHYVQTELSVETVGTLTLRELCGLQACDFNVVPQTHEFQRLALNELPHLLWTVSWSLSDLSKACASYLSRSLDMQISCALDRRRASRNGWLARRD